MNHKPSSSTETVLDHVEPKKLLCFKMFNINSMEGSHRRSTEVNVMFLATSNNAIVESNGRRKEKGMTEQMDQRQHILQGTLKLLAIT